MVGNQVEDNLASIARDRYLPAASTHTQTTPTTPTIQLEVLALGDEEKTEDYPARMGHGRLSASLAGDQVEDNAASIAHDRPLPAASTPTVTSDSDSDGGSVDGDAD